MKVISVNSSGLKPLKMGRRTAQTGHFKEPVGAAQVEALGLVGDAIGNARHHGGPDQAVYIYSAEDYRWWEGHLGRELSLGTFGENLTVSDFAGRPPRIGDIWNCGEVRLQITAPRIPCATLAARMGDPRFAKEFARVNRGGAYARVLCGGLLECGQSVTVEPYPQPSPAVDDLFALWHNPQKDPQILRQALAAPLAVRARAAFEYWLALSEKP
ncbi:MAG: MOSC domain-containing protein [Candidatus Eremiobacteraeota bacterium]|nr:MOSC domain-containing protein [Candidatus Eremiobacteraeota bacterium]MCW5871534.1 MOSC domain-containing protein [Candidatus Eremiobacteraeota bacterium]